MYIKEEKEEEKEITTKKEEKKSLQLGESENQTEPFNDKSTFLSCASIGCSNIMEEQQQQQLPREQIVGGISSVDKRSQG